MIQRYGENSYLARRIDEPPNRVYEQVKNVGETLNNDE
jgi:hypothetical protein